MAPEPAVPRVNMKSAMIHNNYMSVLIDGDTLEFDANLTASASHGGVRAAGDLRALVLDRLRADSIETQGIHVFIHIHANGGSLVSPNPDAEKLYADFLEGFNRNDAFSVYEDVAVSGPRAAGDTLLRQLKDGDCVKVIVAKPYGPGFEALVKAQKHHGVLPTKLTEMIVHPQAARSTQNSYPFMPIASLASQKEPTYKPSQDTLQKELTYKPSQDTSTHHRSTRPTSVQNTPSQIGSAQAGTSQTSTTPPSSAVKIPRNQMGNAQAGTSQTSTTPPGLAVKIPRTQMGNAQVGTSQTSTTPPGSAEKIPRNNSGQRVDPRVNALAWVINASRKRKLCYEYHLQGYCTWSPKPCPNAHSTDSLNVHQLNALQVLARELPCYTGNECQDWACCFGHRCPYSGRCTKGRNCGFYREMHFTDLKVVN